MKTDRELVVEMYRQRNVNTGELIHVQLKAGRRSGVWGKGAIHSLLRAARVAPNSDIVNGLQVELQDAIVSFNEDDREERRCDVALIYLGFVRSGVVITDDLVDKLYRLLGSSFDDLNEGGTYNA